MKTPKQARREPSNCSDSASSTECWMRSGSARSWRKSSQSKPRGYLAILSHFQRLVKLDHARHTAEVESAMPLPLICDSASRLD